MRSFFMRRRFWFKDFVSGGDMWREFRDVRYIMEHPLESEALIEERLSEMLSYAKSHTIFYANVKGDTLSDFPVIDKQVIKSATDDFMTCNKDCCIMHVTSGSTGTPFSAYQDRKSNIRRIATIKVCNETVDFHSCMPMMLLRYSELPHHRKGCFEMEKGSNICFANISSFDDESMKRLADRMNNLGTRFVKGDMSLLEMFTAFVVRTGYELKSHPTFISIGELLTEPLRRRVVDEMHLHIISQYANEENGVLGQSKPDAPGDEIFLNRANCIVELLKLDSNEPAGDEEDGRVVVTDLTNRAMPMIRYDIGDVARRGESLPSGRLLSLKLCACRKMDRIYDTAGEIVGVCIPYEIWKIPTLRQLQFSQLDEKHYSLLLNVSCPSEQVSVPMIEDIFRAQLGRDAQIDVVLTDEIPIMRSGKRKLVKQCCGKYLSH